MYSCCKLAVKINNEYSDLLNLDRGVKQRNGLNPALFNYFINDLHDFLKFYL